MLGFLAGLAAAILTGLGVGSGGLLILYLTAATDMKQLQAQMTNLLFFVLAAFPATLWNLKQKRIDPSAFFLLTLTALLGIFPGAFLSVHISSEILRKCFGAFLATIGSIQLFQKKK